MSRRGSRSPATIATPPGNAGPRGTTTGGCGALGFRLTPAAGPMAGDEAVEVEGLTVYLDFKSRMDLDGARIDVGEADDDLVIVHDQAVVGGFC